MLPQEPCRLVHHIVQSAGSLQRCRGRNDADDDEHHVDGNGSRLKSKDEYQDKDTHHAVDAQSDATHLGSDKYHSQYNSQLE